MLVLFIGKRFNQCFSLLRRYHIPEPVSSGLLVCLVTFVLHLTTGLEISFNMGARDVLLVYFFAGIGLSSDMRSLLSGGVPLIFYSWRLWCLCFYRILREWGRRCCWAWMRRSAYWAGPLL